MTAWAERPRVEATLLNPALVAVLLAAAARDYETQSTRMPWPLALLIPPLVLHRPTREALPRNTRTHLSTWIRRQPLLRAGFPDRAAAMGPLTREGIRFGLRARDGATLTGHLDGEPSEGELRQLLRRAALVGRWLAKPESTARLPGRV